MKSIFYTSKAIVLCLAVIGISGEALAECQYVRGGITETLIAGPNDQFGRVLGNVTGVLNGASTAVILGFNPTTSYDVFVTKSGDMLTANGAVTNTPIPGQPPGEFNLHATLTVTGGSGKYAQASGTILFEGQGHNIFAGPGIGVFDVVYSGTICGPNIKSEGGQQAKRVEGAAPVPGKAVKQTGRVVEGAKPKA